MKKFILALMCALCLTTLASAQNRRFPVATAVGDGINRVVGFPFRVGAAALGIRGPSVQQYGYAQQIRVSRFVAPIKVQRVVAPVYAQQVRVQRVVTQQYGYAQQIQAQRYGYAQQIQAYVAPIQAQAYVAPIQVQRVYAQIQAQAYAAPAVAQEQVCPPAQIVTQKIILRQSVGYCGGVSSFRATYRY